MDPMIIAALVQAASSIIGGGQGGYEKVSTKTRGQRKQQNTALQQWQQLAEGAYPNAIGLLQSLLDPNSQTYKNFEAPYLQQFQQQTIPGIAEQFAGAGALGGGLSSSGFGQALGAAGANLQTSLAQMKENLRMQAAQGILGQYNQGFGQTQQDQFALGPRDPSYGQSFAAGASKGFGQAGANYLYNQQNRGVGSGDTGRGYQSNNPITNELDRMYRTTGYGF